MLAEAKINIPITYGAFIRSQRPPSAQQSSLSGRRGVPMDRLPQGPAPDDSSRSDMVDSKTLGYRFNYHDFDVT